MIVLNRFSALSNHVFESSVMFWFSLISIGLVKYLNCRKMVQKAILNSQLCHENYVAVSSLKYKMQMGPVNKLDVSFSAKGLKKKN